MHRIRYDHTYICIVRRPDLTIACRFRRWANRQQRTPGAAVSHYGSKQHRCRPAALQDTFFDGPVASMPACLAALRFRPSDFADFGGWYCGGRMCSSHAMSEGARCLQALQKPSERTSRMVQVSIGLLLPWCCLLISCHFLTTPHEHMAYDGSAWA